jgi:hypothetical protein
MEPLNLMVTLNLVADDVRHEVTGRGSDRGRGDRESSKPRRRSAWTAVWRKVTRRPIRRVECTPRVSQSFGD